MKETENNLLLQDAFLSDDFDKLDEAMKNDPSIDIRESFLYSIRWGTHRITEYLISNGIDLSANHQELFQKHVESLCSRDREGGGLYDSELKTLTIMFNHGVDVNGQQGQALSHCAQKGNLQLVKFLVENGADVTLRNNRAVSESACENHLEVTLYLLSKGADKEEAMENATPEVEAGLRRNEFYEKIRNATSKIKATFSSKHTQK